MVVSSPPKMVKLAKIGFSKSQFSKMFERGCGVCYLIVVDKFKFDEIVNPSEDFFKYVTDQVTAYVVDGVMPPKEIAGAILNLGDDILSGKTPSIRAGDYIAIQSHLRSM